MCTIMKCTVFYLPITITFSWWAYYKIIVFFLLRAYMCKLWNLMVTTDQQNWFVPNQVDSNYFRMKWLSRIDIFLKLKKGHSPILKRICRLEFEIYIFDVNLLLFLDTMLMYLESCMKWKHIIGTVYVQKRKGIIYYKITFIFGLDV